MVHFDRAVKQKFPEISLALAAVRDLKVEKNDSLKGRWENAMADVRKAYDLSSLADAPQMRAYRAFLWKTSMDPTKSRPAGEALIRRVLQGNEIPSINNAVDAYNIVSMEHALAMGAYDSDRIKGNLTVRFALENEQFKEIGGKPERLLGREVVLADAKKVLCVYPHRDCAATRITEKTKSILLMAYGVPGIPQEKLMEAVKEGASLVQSVAGGNVLEIAYIV